MERENVLAKVKKLFALASNNPSEEEAKVAALKAQELMVKHGIEMAEVDDIDLDRNEEITEVEVDLAAKKWKYTLVNIVAENCRCKVFYRGKNHVIFYGHETDAQIAAEMFRYLFKTGNSLGMKLYNEARKGSPWADTSNIYNSCVMGFCVGVREALAEQSKALMVIMPEDVKEQFEERTKGFGSFSSSAPRAYKADAFRAGRDSGYNAMAQKKIG